MIRLSKHSKEFEEEFYMKVDELIDDNLKKKIIISSEKYLPKTFFSTGNSDSVTEVEKFKVLILADFQKLKNAYEYIENCEKKEIYQRLII